MPFREKTVHEREGDLVRITVSGMRWLAEKSLEKDLRERIIPALESPQSAGAVRLKQTVTRAVYRLKPIASAERKGDLFVKVHRVRSPAEKIKYLVLASRAWKEWEISRVLARLGIPAARAVAVAERRTAGVLSRAVIVTEEIEGAVPLEALIRQLGGSFARADSFRRKRRLLALAAALIRRGHDAGVAHRDLHGGNVLISGEKAFLIDLHRANVGAKVSHRQRLRCTAQFLAYLGDLLTWGDRLHFTRQYLGQDASAEELREFGRQADEVREKLRQRRYASRSKRCVKDSTGFRRERLAGLRVWRRADFPAELVRKAVNEHRAADGKTVLKRDRRGSVTVIGQPGSRRLCVKEFVRPGLLRRFHDFLRGPRALAAWLGANACLVRGIPTPRPLATAQDGSSTFFITEYIEGAARWNDYVADHGRPAGKDAARKWRRFIREAADFVRRLHSHAIWHRDLSAKNILVRELETGWEFHLVDVSDVRPGRKPSLDMKIRNLGQLDQIYVMPSRTDRLRFYRRYSAGLPEFRPRGIPLRINAISRARHRNWLFRGNGLAILEERRRQGKPV